MRYNKGFQPFNMVFGICCIIDGVIAIITFGKLTSSHTLNFARWNAKRKIKKGV